ncbi:MAG: Hpt domain-containing protein [Deltaproteobacteria bacterium]|nr:MAG: Hpt domain-containing protein [Deltaproteobacteria bacterium]
MLERMRNLVPPEKSDDFVRRVFAKFDASSSKLLAQIEAALADDDAAGLGQAVHTLKSSSAQLGADALAQHCAQLEQALRDRRRDDFEWLVESISLELAAVRRELADRNGAADDD